MKKIVTVISILAVCILVFEAALYFSYGRTAAILTQSIVTPETEWEYADPYSQHLYEAVLKDIDSRAEIIVMSLKNDVIQGNPVLIGSKQNDRDKSSNEDEDNEVKKHLASLREIKNFLFATPNFDDLNEYIKQSTGKNYTEFMCEIDARVNRLARIKYAEQLQSLLVKVDSLRNIQSPSEEDVQELQLMEHIFDLKVEAAKKSVQKLYLSSTEPVLKIYLDSRLNLWEKLSIL